MAQTRSTLMDEVSLVSGAIAAVAEVVTGATTGHLTITLVTAAITAVMAVFTRQNVKPMSKVRRHKERTK